MASEKKALKDIQTPQLRHYIEMKESHEDLLGIINDCTKTLDSLTDSIAASGLEDVRGDAFKQWLCDMGMSELQFALRDIDGRTLTMLNVSDVMEYDVTFNDASSLLLHGYMTHYKLSDDGAFAPPRGSVLSWDRMQTANWIKTLGDSYACLSSAGWLGAALCSLSPPRVVEEGRGLMRTVDAIKFIGLVRQVRSETDGDKAKWVVKWSGASTIENQAP